MRRISLHKSQTGIVSFFVVMIIMIVLTLIVLAFAQLVRREQRQTLDRQLKTQALYASESGVNDAIDWISDPTNQDDLFTWNNECDGPGSFIDVANLNNQLDGAGGVTSYSCLLVDPSPESLEKQVSTTTSATFRLQPESGTIGSLRISWTDEAGGSTISGCSAIGAYTGDGTTTTSQPCDIGTLRLEVLPFNSPASRNDLINNRYIAYVQPRSGAAPTEVPYGNGDARGQGQSAPANCNAGTCSVEIINISPAISVGYMRIGSIFRASNVTVEAFSAGNPGASNTPLSMIGSQVEIDATGKANDVLHRIRVNAPVEVAGDGPAPEFALQTRVSQCKRFEIPGAGVVLFPSDPDIPRCNPFQAATPN
jgi:Tfp pilus assembly protein PilX